MPYKCLLSALLIIIMQLPTALIGKELAYDSSQLTLDGLKVVSTDQDSSLLTFHLSDQTTSFPSATIKPPNGMWDFSQNRFIETTFINKGNAPLTIYFWAVASVGHDSVLGQTKLKPGESKKCKINLDKYWTGHLKKLDSKKITALRVMLKKSRKGARFTMGPITLHGKPKEKIKQHKLLVPAMTNEKPAAGNRVRHQLPEYKGTDLYHSLYLPTDWKPGKRYPVIVEYSGNRWYGNSCYSTGRPEDSKMGYGMSEGKGYIWINAPFVDTVTNSIQVDGWGNPDATADYAIKLVRDVCENFGGDPSSVIMTGFSRGAISLGFIGRRNDRVADVWLAFHACQHYDGDGWGGANYNDALTIRGPRIKGRATFHTDNNKPQVKELFQKLSFPVIYATSRLGGHADSMFLDNRPSTVQLRAWLADVVSTKPGTNSISGTITDNQGKGIAGVRVQSGETHFTFTDANGYYLLKGLISGSRKLTASKDSWSRLVAIELNHRDIKNSNFIVKK